MSLSVPIAIGDINNGNSSSSSSTRTTVNLDNLTLEEMVRENPTDVQIGKSFEVIT